MDYYEDSMNLILQALITIVLIEAITNILSKSVLFGPVREFFHKHNKFIHKLLDCPYCTSVWVGIFCVAMLYLYNINVLPLPLALFFMGIVFHRLSNVLHFIIDRINSNYVVFLDKEDN